MRTDFPFYDRAIAVTNAPKYLAQGKEADRMYEFILEKIDSFQIHFDWLVAQYILVLNTMPQSKMRDERIDRFMKLLNTSKMHYAQFFETIRLYQEQPFFDFDPEVRKAFLHRLSDALIDSDGKLRKNDKDSQDFVSLHEVYCRIKLARVPRNDPIHDILLPIPASAFDRILPITQFSYLQKFMQEQLSTL